MQEWHSCRLSVKGRIGLSAYGPGMRHSSRRAACSTRAERRATS